MGDTSITRRILLYIEEHLEKELSLGKIAEEFSYSRFYLARAFKADTGTTIYKYIQGRRLDEAARKLTETQRPIVEIAYEAGYGSQQAFTQTFRRVYLCAPQEYRHRGIFVPKQNRICMCMKDAGLSFEKSGGRMAA